MYFHFVEKVESIIGYEFSDKNLLIQAFTRKSYTAENGGENNEFLEFVGDKALDLAVINIFIKYLGISSNSQEYQEFVNKNIKEGKTKSREGVFSEIKSQLVQSKTLAKTIEELGLEKCLIMGKGDIKKEVQKEMSVKEDLFEAIIGAVAIDSKFDLETISDVVENLIDFENFLNKGYEGSNYIGLLQELCAKNKYGSPNYVYKKFEDGYICSLTIDGLDLPGYQWVASGRNRNIARSNVAKKAYEFFKENEKLEFKKNLVGENGLPYLVLDEEFEKYGLSTEEKKLSPYELVKHLEEIGFIKGLKIISTDLSGLYYFKDEENSVVRMEINKPYEECICEYGENESAALYKTCEHLLYLICSNY